MGLLLLLLLLCGGALPPMPASSSLGNGSLYWCSASAALVVVEEEEGLEGRVATVGRGEPSADLGERGGTFAEEEGGAWRPEGTAKLP